ncbi:MAG: zinc ribbon domain-containing protein [Nitrospira sp.]|nr:zinc ribbon domain-containing protein [Nitrospira sp.]
MSDFLDKVKGKVDEGISKISSKSKEAIELAQLRNQLRHLGKEKEEKINALGRLAYDMLRKDEYNEQRLKELYLHINEVDRQIVNVEEEIKKVQAMSASEDIGIVARCECGAGITANQKFCASCGGDVKAVTMQPSAPQEVMKRCSTCGAEIKETAKFCGKCGAKQ